MMIEQKKADPWPPGTWFALPMPSDGWALGLVARIDPSLRKKSRTMFCYFFGPRIVLPTDYVMPIERRPNERILFGRTSDVGLKEGRWPVLGKLADFDPEVWVMPPFRRRAGGGGPDWKRRFILITYNESFRAVYLDEKGILLDDFLKFPLDAGHGHLAMEQAVDDAFRGIVY